MRLEADSVSRVSTPEGESLVFRVKSVVVRDMLKGTSFDNWMHYPLAEPAITGVVTIALENDSPFVKLNYDSPLRATIMCAICAARGSRSASRRSARPKTTRSCRE